MDEFRALCRNHRLCGKYHEAATLPATSTAPYSDAVGQLLISIERQETAIRQGWYAWRDNLRVGPLGCNDTKERHLWDAHATQRKLKFLYMKCHTALMLEDMYHEAGVCFGRWEKHCSKLGTLGGEVQELDVIDVRATYCRIALLAAKFHFGQLPPGSDNALRILTYLNDRPISLPADEELLLPVLELIAEAVVAIRPLGIDSVGIDLEKWFQTVSLLAKDNKVSLEIKARAAHLAGKFPCLAPSSEMATWYLYRASALYDQVENECGKHEVRIANLCRMIVQQQPAADLQMQHTEELCEAIEMLSKEHYWPGLAQATVHLIDMLDELNPQKDVFDQFEKCIPAHHYELVVPESRLITLDTFCRIASVITQPPWDIPVECGKMANTLVDLGVDCMEASKSQYLWLAGRVCFFTSQAMQIYDGYQKAKSAGEAQERPEGAAGPEEWAAACLRCWEGCWEGSSAADLQDCMALPLLSPPTPRDKANRSVDEKTVDENIARYHDGIEKDVEMGRASHAWMKGMVLARISLGRLFRTIQEWNSTRQRYIQPRNPAVSRRQRLGGALTIPDDPDLGPDILADPILRAWQRENGDDDPAASLWSRPKSRLLFDCLETLEKLLDSSSTAQEEPSGDASPTMRRYEQRLYAEKLVKLYHRGGVLFARHLGDVPKIQEDLHAIYTRVERLSRRFGICPWYPASLAFYYFIATAEQFDLTHSRYLFVQCQEAFAVADFEQGKAGMTESLLFIRSAWVKIVHTCALEGFVPWNKVLEAIFDAEASKQEFRLHISILGMCNPVPSPELFRCRQNLSREDPDNLCPAQQLCTYAFEANMRLIEEARVRRGGGMLMHQEVISGPEVSLLWESVQHYKTTAISDFFTQGTFLTKVASETILNDDKAREKLALQNSAVAEFYLLEGAEKRPSQDLVREIHSDMLGYSHLKKLAEARDGTSLELKEIHAMYRQLRGQLGQENIVFADFAMWDREIFITSVRNEGTPCVARCSIRPAVVKDWFRLYGTCSSPDDLSDESNHCLRLLDSLVAPLLDLSSPGDLVILCPWRMLSCIPLHALWVDQETPLIARNPTVYAPSLTLFSRAWKATKDLKRPNAAVSVLQCAPCITVPAPGPLHRDATRASPLDCTHRRVLDAFSQSRIIDIYGSVIEDNKYYPGLNSLILNEVQRLFCLGHLMETRAKAAHVTLVVDEHESDFPDAGAETSDTVESASGNSSAWGDFTKSPKEGNPKLVASLLTTGSAASVLSTFWPVNPDGDNVKDMVSGFYRELSKQPEVTEKNIGNLPRAFQSAVLAMREKKGGRPADWIPFMLTGSPMMRFPPAAPAKTETGPEIRPNQNPQENPSLKGRAGQEATQNRDRDPAEETSPEPAGAPQADQGKPSSAKKQKPKAGKKKKSKKPKSKKTPNAESVQECSTPNPIPEASNLNLVEYLPQPAQVHNCQHYQLEPNRSFTTLGCWLCDLCGFGPLYGGIWRCGGCGIYICHFCVLGQNGLIEE